ncbi:uncharacterized protein LOC131611040 [Vicia villosa]|uniref:uncharacterized protein LOC131611040 n=1 Tax=Vicia villosa TaxID=3911 RepID=UPI00273B4045|nr:uncharacterized protein LOC131611040 [Vicia villosa]
MANGVVEVEIAPEDIASEIDFWASSLILSFSDRDEVMMRGPYTIRNMPLLLKEWRPDFKLKDDFLRTIPQWVKLPQLPLYLWGEMSLNKIGSALGTPLVNDECTANRLQISYARILVEMDIIRDLPNEITICDNEGMKMQHKIWGVTQQGVEYEWKPIYCARCQNPGHNCDKPKPKVTQWKPKAKPPENPTTDQPSQHKTVDPIVKDVASQPYQTDAWIEVRKSGMDRDFAGPASAPRLWSMIVSWNLRGLNKPGKLREISSRLLELKAYINILIETRVKPGQASTVRNKLNLGDNYLDNYSSHANGRLWIHWNSNNVDIQVRASTSQMIHCGIYDVSGSFRFWMTAIYGLNQLEQRRILWKDLENLNIQGPWCLVGDFNNVLKGNDRIRGHLVTEAEVRDLQYLMDLKDLSEMDSYGDHYTWFNNHTVGPIYSRIDKVLANTAWFQTNMNTTLKILPPSVSDHSMLCLANQNATMKIH